jgi:hypothetical protein
MTRERAETRDGKRIEFRRMLRNHRRLDATYAYRSRSLWRKCDSSLRERRIARESRA